MLLLIDNFDSFTYNLVQEIECLGVEVQVLQNNASQIPVNPTYILISPGPGNPQDAGISKKVIANSEAPLMGVCLGMQCIAELFGGKVVHAPLPVHGKTSRVFHSGRGIFESVKQGFEATRYHSLMVERESLPDCLEIIAETEDGIVMGLQHRERDIVGVQFHPESILTTEGSKIIQNFLQIT